LLLEIILTFLLSGLTHLFEVAFETEQEQNSAAFSCHIKYHCILAEFQD